MMTRTQTTAYELTKQAIPLSAGAVAYCSDRRGLDSPFNEGEYPRDRKFTGKK